MAQNTPSELTKALHELKAPPPSPVLSPINDPAIRGTFSGIQRRMREHACVLADLGSQIRVLQHSVRRLERSSSPIPILNTGSK